MISALVISTGAILAQTPPTLLIDPVPPDSVRLAWDDADPDWVLQGGMSLEFFETILVAPSLDGGQIALTRERTEGSFFYRLLQQETSGIDGGENFLYDSQSALGLWGELVVSATVLNAIGLREDVVESFHDAVIDDDGRFEAGLDALSVSTPRNNDELSRMIIALAGEGHNVDALVDDLLGAASPGGGGWGATVSYAPTNLDTALTLRALVEAGLPQGLTVVGDEIPAGLSSAAFPFEVPVGATGMFLEIDDLDGNARFNLTRPSMTTSFFDATPAGVPTGVSFGTPEAGSWTLQVDNNAGVPVTYSAQVRFTTAEGLDVGAFTGAASLLGGSQNGDGGWGIFAGGDSHILSTFETMHTLSRLGGGFEEPLLDGAGWFYSNLRNVDGGYSSEPDNSNPLETAMAIIAIRASGAPHDLVPAITFLESQQLLNGSWENDSFVTAMAIMALYVPPEPPVVSSIPDQTVEDPTLFSTIDLDAFVADPDHDDSEISWSVSGQTLLGVSIVDRVATITYPSATALSETLTFTATDPDGEADSTTATFTVTLVPLFDYSIARGGSVSDNREFTTTAANFSQIAFFTDYPRVGIPADVTYTTDNFFTISPDTFQPQFTIAVGPSAPLGIHTFTVEYGILDAGTNPLLPVFGNVFEFTIEITP